MYRMEKKKYLNTGIMTMRNLKRLENGKDKILSTWRRRQKSREINGLNTLHTYLYNIPEKVEGMDEASANKTMNDIQVIYQIILCMLFRRTKISRNKRIENQKKKKMLYILIFALTTNFMGIFFSVFVHLHH